MFKNLIKTSARNLLKNKTYSIISIFCLSLGLIACFNIGLFVDDELKHDKFHPDYRDIHRITAKIISGGSIYDEARCQFPLARAFKSTFPGVVETVRMHKVKSPLIVYEENKFLENKFLFADASFFELFGFELVKGQADEVLKHPNSVVLTESTAKKYFGNDDPIGRSIKYNNEQLLKVTGIARDFRQSHIDFDFVASLDFLFGLWRESRGPNGPSTKWYWTGAWTYARFENDLQKELIEEQLPSFVKTYFPEAWKNQASLHLQRIDRIHLTSDLIREIKPNGSLQNVSIFSLLAILLLFISCFNFVNLMTAQGLLRARKMGIKRVLGASNFHIIGQVLFEAIIICFVSGILALLVTYLTVSDLNTLVNKTIDFEDYLTPLNLLLFIAAILTLGVLAGLYPAIHFSRFGHTSVQKGTQSAYERKNGIREILVGVQFLFSVILIISVIIIHDQRAFLANKDLGFDKESVLVIRAQKDQNKNFNAFKSELLRISDVVSVCGVYDAPGEDINSIRFIPEGGSKSNPVSLLISTVGHDFLKTLNIDMLEGRFFSEEFQSDYDDAFVLNEAAVKELGWEGDPIGKKLDMFGGGTDEIAMEGKVIGVMKDYHHESLHTSVKPIVFNVFDGRRYYLVKFKTNDYKQLISSINAVWEGFGQLWPMEYQLLDERMEALYQKEEDLSRLMDIALYLALLIACIGIFGLSSYIIQGRIKEASIRRVLGSTINSLLVLLSRKFLILVVVSNITAWPITYYLMSNWLNNFEFSVEINFLLFLFAGLVTLSITFVITGFHSFKVAKVNPVDNLRND